MWDIVNQCLSILFSEVFGLLFSWVQYRSGFINSQCLAVMSKSKTVTQNTLSFMIGAMFLVVQHCEMHHQSNFHLSLTCSDIHCKVVSKYSASIITASCRLFFTLGGATTTMHSAAPWCMVDVQKIVQIATTFTNFTLLSQVVFIKHYMI